MSFDWALKPVSDDTPTGPNLDTSDDADFVDYYFDALGRLPDRYVVPGMETEGGRRTEDRIFDPKTIDIKAENTKIKTLLERSRDLRLLTLQAQFECLTGRAKPLADTIETIADLIDLFGDAVHPAIEGDSSERKEALNELAQPITIVTALRYMGLSGGSDVTLRKLSVAEGKQEPHTGEDGLSLQAMQGVLGSPGNRKIVDEANTSFIRISEALKRIQASCQSHESAAFSLNLEPTLEVLAEMRGAIKAARPDLRSSDTAGTSKPAEPKTTENNQTAQAGADTKPPPQTGSVTIKSHAEARLALISCETYFQSYEPSSAALLLVRQARQLIGKPLVVALETLLPEECGKALVSFGPQSGFAIPAQRLKSLTDDSLPVPSLDSETENSADAPTVSSSADLAGIMLAVENFFDQREKSSPVPLLLQRARNYLDKDFQALVDELIPRSE